MYTPNLGNEGYGWVVGSLMGRRTVDKAGGIEGFSTYILRFPDDGITVIVLSNVRDAPAGPISRQLAQVVLGAAVSREHCGDGF